MRRAARCSRTRVLSAAEGTRRQGDQCHGSTARLHAHAREGAGREGTYRISAVGRPADRSDPEGLGYRCSAAAEAVLLDICCGSEPARPSAVSILVPSRPPAPPIRREYSSTLPPASSAHPLGRSLSSLPHPGCSMGACPAMQTQLCGSGGILGLSLARQVEHVVGIELVQAAIDDAKVFAC